MNRSKDTRALVTGGAGFIGTHLVSRLMETRHETLVVDDLSRGRPSHLPSAARLEVADVASDDLDALFAMWQPHVVFHLAAQTSVPISTDDPELDLRVNVIGTRRTLEAARRAGSATFVFVSSGGAVYGETRQPASERTVPRPRSYYGMHKLLAEHYVRNADLPTAIARPANVYGPGQLPGTDGAVVPSLILAAIEGRPLPIHGSGKQVRDFVYVDDMVDALLVIAQHGAGTWNVASGRPITILALAEAVASSVGSKMGLAHTPPRPSDVRRSQLSNTRLEQLGWAPRTSLHDGVKRTVESLAERSEDDLSAKGGDDGPSKRVRYK